jgi:hypothetical protein
MAAYSRVGLPADVAPMTALSFSASAKVFTFECANVMHSRVPRSAPARYCNFTGSYWLWLSSSSRPRMALGDTAPITVPSWAATL